MICPERAIQNFAAFSDKFQMYLDKIKEQEVQVKNYELLMDAEYRKVADEGLRALSLEETTHYQNLVCILKGLEQPISRMETQLQTMEDNLLSAERIKILNWLSSIPYKQHHIQARTDILEGTGGWFLNDDKLLEWRRSSSSSIMWLHGIPGSGKSKLV